MSDPYNGRAKRGNANCQHALVFQTVLQVAFHLQSERGSIKKSLRKTERLSQLLARKAIGYDKLNDRFLAAQS